MLTTSVDRGGALDDRGRETEVETGREERDEREGKDEGTDTGGGVIDD